jgi:hypothetical protein
MTGRVTVDITEPHVRLMPVTDRRGGSAAELHQAVQHRNALPFEIGANPTRSRSIGDVG